MKFNKLIFPTLLGALLVSCSSGNITSNINSSSFDDFISSDLSSQEESSSEDIVSESSLGNSIDYSLFDESIVGTWYVHQSMMGLAYINEVITIRSNYTASFLGVNFSFVGMYEGFEGTCLFKST